MRARYGKARHRAKKRLFKEARGNFGGRSKLLRTVKETIIRSRAYATRDRRVRKREFRALWITRITAAVRERGLSYSAFMHGLSLASIALNRKQLSELAVQNPEVFNELVEASKKARASAA
ncbi:MAG: 50S ribosomal protein L20 [Planctomycetaceae bacterium]|jgi:large subunit ribosomal protein L20